MNKTIAAHAGHNTPKAQSGQIPPVALKVMRKSPTKLSVGPSDATIAVSEAGLTLLVQRALDQPIVGSGSGSWGPFVAGYNVNLTVSGGKIELPDLGGAAQIVRLTDVIIQGSVGASFGLDLARVLPQVCIPPFRACIPSPWGDICTPQVCISWPTISIPITIPILPIGLSADFGIAAYQDGDNWQVDLKVFPFSLFIDLTPTVNYIIDTVKQVVHDTLGTIPLIGDLIAGLVDVVLNALRAILDAILGAIKEFIRSLILLIDLFSPTIPFHITQIPAIQKILAAGGPGDREVDLRITTLDTSVADHELLLLANFA